MKTLSLVAACGLVFGLFPACAMASPILWTFNNVTFIDGGTMTGSFVYDPDTSTESDVDIYTSDGSWYGNTETGTQYTSPGGSIVQDTADGSWNLYFYADVGGYLEETIGIFLSQYPLDTSGSISLTYAFERLDNYASGSQQNVFFRQMVSEGTITGVSESAPEAPEPGTMLTMVAGTGVLALGSVFRRWKQKLRR